MHGYASAGTPRRMLDRHGAVLWEILAALPCDMAIRVGFGAPAIRRIEPGHDAGTTATRVALYAHYAPLSRISDMVRMLHQAGFAVTFITSSATIQEDDWQDMRRSCALLIQRRNLGRDFGAWCDAVPEVRRRWPGLQELMLANDSVIGPLYPMPPVMAALRSGGDGLFGLTESLQGGAHLQSYMLMARGTLA